MRIVRCKADNYDWKKLRDIRKGACIAFKHCFHQTLTDDDVFMPIDASAYPARNDAAHSKIAVINLSNGRLSFVDRGREVRELDAAICIEDERNG